MTDLNNLLQDLSEAELKSIGLLLQQRVALNRRLQTILHQCLRVAVNHSDGGRHMGEHTDMGRVDMDTRDICTPSADLATIDSIGVK